jgi:hypothetical protein
VGRGTDASTVCLFSIADVAFRLPGGLFREPLHFVQRPDPPGNLHSTAIAKTQTKTPKISLSRKEEEELTVRWVWPLKAPKINCKEILQYLLLCGRLHYNSIMETRKAENFYRDRSSRRASFQQPAGSPHPGAGVSLVFQPLQRGKGFFSLRLLVVCWFLPLPPLPLLCQ